MCISPCLPTWPASRHRFIQRDALTSVRRVNTLHPKKLLLSKWTAVAPVDCEKHFLVTRIVQPVVIDLPIEWVEIEAIHSGAIRRIRWGELKEKERWHQGWV